MAWPARHGLTTTCWFTSHPISHGHTKPTTAYTVVHVYRDDAAIGNLRNAKRESANANLPNRLRKALKCRNKIRNNLRLGVGIRLGLGLGSALKLFLLSDQSQCFSQPVSQITVRTFAFRISQITQTRMMLRSITTTRRMPMSMRLKAWQSASLSVSRRRCLKRHEQPH